MGSISAIQPSMMMPETSGVTAAANAAFSSTKNTRAQNSKDPTMGDFLQMLATELKEQDPTAPLDVSQMTQQIVSLNQLQQLIGIHQVLKDTTNSAAATSNTAAANGTVGTSNVTGANNAAGASNTAGTSSK